MRKFLISSNTLCGIFVSKLSKYFKPQTTLSDNFIVPFLCIFFNLFTEVTLYFVNNSYAFFRPIPITFSNFSKTSECLIIF